MSGLSTPIILVILGWLTVPIVGIAVIVSRGSEEAGVVLVTSTIASFPGATTRSVMRTCSLSVPAYFFVSESER